MVNCSCVFSALCFLINNALRITLMDKRAKESIPDFWSKLTSLDTEFLKTHWMNLRKSAPLKQTSTIFNILAWTFFLVPILQLCWFTSQNGKRLIGIHTVIVSLVLAGCLMEVISGLLYFGGWGTTYMISKYYTLSGWSSLSSSGEEDMMGYKVLEMVFTILNGMTLWIDTFEWFCLFVIMSMLYYSLGTILTPIPSQLKLCGRLGLIIALLSFIDLSASILRLEDWKFFTKFTRITSIINTCLLLPIWLFWLSCTIPNNNNNNLFDNDNINDIQTNDDGNN